MTQRNVRSIVQRLGIVSAAVLLHGCGGAAYVKMSPEASAEMKSAPAVYVVKYRTAGVHLMTPKSVSGGGLIVGMTGSAELPSGSTLVKAYGLPDQAEAVGADLAEKLKAEGGMRNVRVEPGFVQAKQEDASRYRAKYPSGLVLELDIRGAGAGYGAMNWKTYTYGYVGKASLIRASDGAILWSDYCGLGTLGDEADKRKLDVTEFEANGGKRFKEVYHYSNERCSRILADKLLGKAS
jgi:hypothetical protein